MHRIDTIDATPDNKFTEGNPTIPLPATTVSAAWLNSVQEELVTTILQTGLALGKDNNTQLLQAIRSLGGEAVWNAKQNYAPPCLKFGANGKLYLALLASGPAIAGVGAKDPAVAANATYWLDYAASITPPPAEKYEIGQYSWFEDDMPRAGLFSCLGGVVQNFSTKYPKAAAYFNTTYGQKRLVTQAQYDTLHVAVWHTNADGTKVGWEGIGGVNNFVWDKTADTLRLPDLAGMTPEQVGFDSLGVGGVRGDALPRALTGEAGGVHGSGGGANGIFKNNGAYWWQTTAKDYPDFYKLGFDVANVYAVAAKNQVRAWISDARVYLGHPSL